MTIKDIARLSNVSTATVSRVLNGKPDVKYETRNIVLDVIKKHNYHPSFMAKGVLTKKSDAIGLVVPHEKPFVNPFFVEILRGINNYANKSGYYILLCTSKNEPENVLCAYREGRIDGILLVSPKIDGTFPLNALMSEKIPIMSTSKTSNFENISYVDVDNYLGACYAVEHLICLGHQRIALISGPAYFESSNDRNTAYFDSLKKNNISIDEEFVVAGSHTMESGYYCAEKLLSGHKAIRPTAIFVSGDIMALGVLKYLRRKNIKVPNDISIVGFDDIPYAELVEPPLTTIRQSPYIKGYVAASSLIDMIANQEKSVFRKLLPVELIIRNSTAAPHINNGGCSY